MTEARVSQAMRPRGLVGWIFAFLMERMNAQAYRWTIEQLRPRDPKSLFELGFGAGRFLEIASGQLPLDRIRGVDPSALMVDQASARLGKLKRQIDVDLLEGDNKSRFWPNEKFDAIVALHSFQFWTSPEATLERVGKQLEQKGLLIIVLRRHDIRSRSNNLPNPLSRSAEEIAGTKSVLSATGFELVRDEALDRASFGLVARRRE